MSLEEINGELTLGSRNAYMFQQLKELGAIFCQSLWSNQDPVVSDLGLLTFRIMTRCISVVSQLICDNSFQEP